MDALTLALPAQTTPPPPNTAPAMDRVFLHVQGQLLPGSPFETTVDTANQPPPAPNGPGNRPPAPPPGVHVRVTSLTKNGDGYRVQYEINFTGTVDSLPADVQKDMLVHVFGASGFVVLKPGVPMKVLAAGPDVNLTLTLTL